MFSALRNLKKETVMTPAPPFPGKWGKKEERRQPFTEKLIKYIYIYINKKLLQI